jgi:hypothetical protein
MDQGRSVPCLLTSDRKYCGTMTDEDSHCLVTTRQTSFPDNKGTAGITGSLYFTHHIGRWAKYKNPAILRVVHYRQNPLVYTVFSVRSDPTLYSELP